MVEQADGNYGGNYHQYLKKAKHKEERRQIKRLINKYLATGEDNTTTLYSRYSGYES